MCPFNRACAPLLLRPSATLAVGCRTGPQRQGGALWGGGGTLRLHRLCVLFVSFCRARAAPPLWGMAPTFPGTQDPLCSWIILGDHPLGAEGARGVEAAGAAPKGVEVVFPMTPLRRAVVSPGPGHHPKLGAPGSWGFGDARPAWPPAALLGPPPPRFVQTNSTAFVPSSLSHPGPRRRWLGLGLASTDVCLRYWSVRWLLAWSS